MCMCVSERDMDPHPYSSSFATAFSGFSGAASAAGSMGSSFATCRHGKDFGPFATPGDAGLAKPWGEARNCRALGARVFWAIWWVLATAGPL